MIIMSYELRHTRKTRDLVATIIYYFDNCLLAVLCAMKVVYILLHNCIVFIRLWSCAISP